MPFTFEKLDLEGVTLVTPKKFSDDRGYFLETYKFSDFFEGGIKETFTQSNQSLSMKDTLRGIHFQNHPKPQGKLVRCVWGEIFDVAVDLRPTSTTFMQWVGVKLSDKNWQMLYIPPGFGHGFLTLSTMATIQYMCTAEYDHSLDSGIAWNDPEINIGWGIKKPLLSEKDQNAPTLYKYLRDQGY